MEIVSGQRVMEIDRGEGGEEGQEYGSGSAYEAHVAQGGDTSPATIDVWILGEWDTYVLNGFLFATYRGTGARMFAIARAIHDVICVIWLKGWLTTIRILCFIFASFID